MSDRACPPGAAPQLPAMSASGDPWSVGFALGRHCAAILRQALEQRFTADILQWRHSTRLAELRDAGRAHFPQVYRELEGLARGAVIPFDDILLFNCIPDLPSSHPRSE